MAGNPIGNLKGKTGFGNKGYKPGSMIAAVNKKKGIKTTGKFKGKSNKLGQGGRAAQLKAKGVPSGVIGELARRAQAAPGQKNYH
jgi:hypothetical protein